MLRNVSEVVRDFVLGERGEDAVVVMVVVVVVRCGGGRGGRRRRSVVVVVFGGVVGAEENDVVFVEFVVGNGGVLEVWRVRWNTEEALRSGGFSIRESVRTE